MKPNDPLRKEEHQIHKKPVLPEEKIVMDRMKQIEELQKQHESKKRT